MNYIDILNSDFFKQTYLQIEELKKDYPVNHGFIHIHNVIKSAKRLAITFKLNNKETELLLISAALHDIGYLNGKDEHAYNGSNLVKPLLKNWGFLDTEISIITNAIKNHGGKNQEDYQDIISMCLIIADKLDFINTRYDLNKIKEEHKYIFPYISDTYLDYIENTITLNITITNGFSLNEFENSNYYNKLNKFLILLSNRLNSNYYIKYLQI